jgi:hypothetical protein
MFTVNYYAKKSFMISCQTEQYLKVFQAHKKLQYYQILNIFEK